MPRPIETAPLPSPFGRGPTGMSGAVTLGLGLLFLVLLFAVSFGLPLMGRSVAFERGPEAVARVYERRLELTAALIELPAWEHSVLAPFVPAGPQTTDEALQAFLTVIENGRVGFDTEDTVAIEQRDRELDGLRARRAVLLAGLGRLGEAQGDLDQLDRNGHGAFVTAAKALVNGRAAVLDLGLAGEGWIGRTARARAEGNPLPAPGPTALKTLKWARGLAAGVGLGALILVAWLARNRPDLDVGVIAIPSPWSPQTAFGVLVRAAFLGFLILAVFAVLRETTSAPVPLFFEALAASAPLYYLVRRHLARPNRLELIDIVGFPATRSVVILTTAGLFALDQLGGRALANAAIAMGATEPWTFQVDAQSLWSGDFAFAVSAVDAIVFGVLAREIVFRGVLFPSLRHIHGPVHAAVLSGLLFSAVHMATFPMMLSLAWTGFVCALAVERTRSLLPAILAAMASAVFELGMFSALYR